MQNSTNKSNQNSSSTLDKDGKARLAMNWKSVGLAVSVSIGVAVIAANQFGLFRF